MRSISSVFGEDCAANRGEDHTAKSNERRAHSGESKGDSRCDSARHRDTRSPWPHQPNQGAVLHESGWKSTMTQRGFGSSATPSIGETCRACSTASDSRSMGCSDRKLESHEAHDAVGPPTGAIRAPPARHRDAMIAL